jgi:hypothetical protein
MEFKNKIYDGNFEVAEVSIENEGQIFRGMLYFPPEKHEKPYPLIIYFHGFPQLFSLKEIIQNYEYLLNLGFAFLIFNFRGYKYSEGTISIKSQVSDCLKVIEFVEKMANHDIFNLNDINILAHDFGAFIALILSSKVNTIKNLLLLTPILDLQRHVESEEFYKALSYINRFLPGSVRGLENIPGFIKMTKKELSKKDYKIERVIQRLKTKKLKIIIGGNDKLTPIVEVERIFKNCNITPQVVIIESMEHESVDEDDIEKIENEIKKFFNI